jgi:hypothetical protein
VKRFIKQTPLLWNWLTKARAALGSRGKQKRAGESAD